MPSLDLIDHSPHHEKPHPPLESAARLVMIDNYDSFTWNVYQYLVLEGANVTVYRNDQVTLEELIVFKPSQLIVSPGPGHPVTDTGVSREAIQHFAGKIPVFGVCMGEQCIFSVFGGEVIFAGEILHGKTSPLKHDARGVFSGVPQDIPVTRYHSLAGTHKSLPDSLEVSAWSNTGATSEQGVIMGVRHKKFTVEGVQFHPESILTAEGRVMIRNFLKMKGGTWEENQEFQQSQPDAAAVPQLAKAEDRTNGLNGDADTKKTSILEEIYQDRMKAVAAQKLIPSQTPRDLQESYDLGIAPPQISFPDRLRQSPFPLSLMAEIKRASPSKGIISEYVSAPAQGRLYALAGASVISVLTEPRWFKGSLDDMRRVRQALEGMKNRPAVLRKEFVFDKYQILEARLAGADTILLIVKMLNWETLERLYKYSQSLGMEPLVEVNTPEEMATALKLGSKVIGVNNRNLTSFEVDMGTTSRLLDLVPKDTIVCALSGITGPEDVEVYRKEGVGAVLIGEALMRASDTSGFIAKLFGISKASTTAGSLLVKICGTRTPEAAQAAVEAGADLIGMILVEGRSRCVPVETALEISKVVHEHTRPIAFKDPASEMSKAASGFFAGFAESVRTNPRALLVGVFQNQSLEYVLAMQKKLSLDVVQLHGQEPLEWARQIPVPVLRSFKPTDFGCNTRGYHALPLLDSGAGGTGERVSLSQTVELLQRDPGLRVALAGGLTPDNLTEVYKGLGNVASRVAVVDVSSGVEENGAQSLEKIRQFIQKAKSIRM